MGRYSDAGSAAASNAAEVSGSNVQLLRATAGVEQIAVGDLLALKGVPARAYPVRRIDYGIVSAAGAAAVASTTALGANSSNLTRQRAIVDQASGDIFFTHGAGLYSGNPSGAAITKYGAAGDFIKNQVFASIGVGASDCQTMFLSNGNIIVFWWESGGDNGKGMYFAIVDKLMNSIVAKTLVSSNVTANPSSFAFCTALSGGGFAISWGQAGGLFLTIRSNTGAVVFPETKVQGSPNTYSTGMFSRMVQLSSGNIFIAIAGIGKAAFAIYSPTGAVVVGFTEFGNEGYGAAEYPEVSVMNGCVCMVSGKIAAVISNAGVIQGGVISLAAKRIVNDGTYFWMFDSQSTKLLVYRIPVTGLPAVQTEIPISAAITGDVIQHEIGFSVFDGNSYVLTKEFDGTLSVAEKYTGISGGTQTIKLTDDCILTISDGNFQVTKYRNSSIFGVAQKAIAAGNMGALVQVISGVCGSYVNALPGKSGKKFDHSASPIAGAKGAIYNNAVTFQGIA